MEILKLIASLLKSLQVVHIACGIGYKTLNLAYKSLLDLVLISAVIS